MNARYAWNATVIDHIASKQGHDSTNIQNCAPIRCSNSKDAVVAVVFSVRERLMAFDRVAIVVRRFASEWRAVGVDSVGRQMFIALDSLRGSSIKIGTILRRLAWPLRKDDTHTSRSVNK